MKIKQKNFTANEILKKFLKIETAFVKKKNRFFRTRSRNSKISIDMIGYTLGVYNGKFFVPVQIGPDMMGYPLGFFAPTRNFEGHSKKKKGKKSKK